MAGLTLLVGDEPETAAFLCLILTIQAFAVLE
jgi:hypothetical protein